MAKLTEHEFNQYCIDNNLSDLARREIQSIRAAQPARLVTSRKNNVSGQYASKKMGVSIQYESQHIELPFIHMLEHNSDVLEYYDQPPSMRVRYLQSQKNSYFTVLSTPDFFVIYKDRAEWVECKPENKLKELCEKDPDRFSQGKDGKWHSYPFEQYASQFGFSFRIFSSSEINGTYIRNINYLKDYLCSDDKTVSLKAANSIKSLIESEPGISLKKLTEASTSYTPDDINNLIVLEEIYVNLYETPLAEADKAYLFLNKQIADTYKLLVANRTETLIKPKIKQLKIGNRVLLDGKVFLTSHIGDTYIYFQSIEPDGNTVPLKYLDIENLITKKLFSIIDYCNNEEAEFQDACLEILKKAGPKDIEEANRRYQAIQCYKKGEDISRFRTQKEDKSKEATIESIERNIRNWIKNYEEAQSIYGSGYLGLFPNTKDRGNRTPRLDDKTIAIINKFINEEYETYKQQPKIACYHQLGNILATNEPPLPNISYTTFLEYIEDRDMHQTTLKRKGKRSSYKYEEWFSRNLEYTTPIHGDRPFEIVHIDHTELDIELISSNGINLGRPWLTLMIDAYSRRILAYYLTFNPPSYRSCMMVIRECVRKYNRLPQYIVVDNGKEFKSRYFTSLLARYEVSHKVRPPAKARFGSVCERMFGTTNTQFIYTLTGNTQITKEVRVMTTSNNPKNLATWNFQDFKNKLEEFFFDIYENKIHTTLGKSPFEMYNIGITTTGLRTTTFIEYGDEFKISTLPTTQRGSAKIEANVGIKLHYLLYWSELFRGHEKTKVDVRYDPFNMGIVYAYIQNQWVLCRTKSKYMNIFSNLSEKELSSITTQMRKEMSISGKKYKITDKAIVNFYINNNKHESSSQIKKEEEQQNNNQAIGIVPQNKNVTNNDQGQNIEADDKINAKKVKTYNRY